MNSTDFLKFIADEIHTTVVATVDDNGLPVTTAIDMMDYNENGLYFLTAVGKSFYDRLKKRGYIALTGVRGDRTMSCVAVSVRGRVRELGSGPLARLITKNPYMNEIYPTPESQKALTVFQLYDGCGEWFDLSKKPIERASFSFGSTCLQSNSDYRITDLCSGCGTCGAVCPQGCIDFSEIPARIIQKNCLHCGNCLSVCPPHAVIRKDDSNDPD